MRKVLIAITMVLSFVSFSYALNTETHEAINENIAKNTLNGFSLDAYLKDQLGIQGGIEESFDSYEVWWWLRKGGLYEDIPPWDLPNSWGLPYLRSVNHFHNPLTDQGYSGFWGTGVMSGMSSTQWALLPQNTQSTFCYLGCYSWYDVRDYYYSALTATDKTTREYNFADTFRGIGHLMHLIQDVSVPSHTRDDGHLFYNYEKYAGSYVNEYGVPTPTSSEFFSGTINDIASFIETNQYDGADPDPNVTVGASIGLSEYTNANFFSEDTINASNFPYPQITEDMPIVERMFTNPRWNTTYSREYYLKDCCGETNGGQGYLLSAVDRLDYYRQQYPLLSFALPKIPVLDDYVYADYASFLIPRAVGYSAGLINYFFRGEIEISLPDTGVYNLTANPAQGFTNITLLAKNVTPNGEEMTDGSIELVVKHRLALDDPFQSYPVPTTEEFYYIVVPEANNIRSIPGDSTVELTFDLSQTPIPLYATDVYLQVVYKGKLGQEDGAVAVGFKDISEPTTIDLFNDADMICLNGGCYVAGSPDAIAQVDTNQNGIADEWDVYPHDVRDIYIRYSPADDPQYASTTQYNFSVPYLAAGEFSRVQFILSDYQFTLQWHKN